MDAVDWLQFFSSLAWPAVAVLALLLFLKPLRQIVLSLLRKPAFRAAAKDPG